MKHAVLRFNVNIMLEHLKEDSKNMVIKNNPLPNDTKFVRGGYDCFGNLYLVLESSTFEDIKENDGYPVIPNPEFERIYK